MLFLSRVQPSKRSLASLLLRNTKLQQLVCNSDLVYVGLIAMPRAFDKILEHDQNWLLDEIATKTHARSESTSEQKFS
jgi:hypothetical protein